MPDLSRMRYLETLAQEAYATLHKESKAFYGAYVSKDDALYAVEAYHYTKDPLPPADLKQVEKNLLRIIDEEGFIIITEKQAKELKRLVLDFGIKNNIR